MCMTFIFIFGVEKGYYLLSHLPRSRDHGDCMGDVIVHFLFNIHFSNHRYGLEGMKFEGI